MTPTHRRRRGVALLLVMIAVAVAVIMSTTFVVRQSVGATVISNVDRHAQARQIAEAGLRLAQRHVNDNTDWRDSATHGVPWITDQSLAGGTFTVTPYDGDDLVGDGDLDDDATDTATLLCQATYQGVTYTTRAIVTPGGLANILLITGSDPPSTRDVARRSLMESMGYQVTMLEDGAASIDYSNALANAHVVYLSEEVVSGSVSSTVYTQSIGVVSEEYASHDDMGLSTSPSSSATGTAVTLTNVTHPVTAGFSTGNLSLYSGSSGLNTLNATLGSGVLTLGVRPGTTEPMIGVLNKGATMANGSPAPGRRVALPYGGDDADTGLLTANGITLLSNALTWAIGSGLQLTGQNIGTWTPAGSHTENNGTYTVLAAGNDIWNSSDQFRYLYTTLTGDGSMTARVVSMTNTDSWAKAGVMIRETLAANSRHGMMVITPGSGAARQGRLTTGGGGSHTGQGGIKAPYWVRIERQGNNIRGYRSATGADGSWIMNGSALTYTSLPNQLYIGLCLTSHKSGTLCTAVFDNISTSGGVDAGTTDTTTNASTRWVETP